MSNLLVSKLIGNKVNSSICSSSISVSIVTLLTGSPKTSVLAKFELFWFNIEGSMLLILLKGLRAMAIE